MAYNNSSNINVTGIVRADGSGGFTGQTVTQYNVIVGGASNALSSVAPSATSGVPLISQGNAANPTFGTVVPAGGGTGTSTVFTQGSVVFAGASGVYTQDNTNFFWDDANNRLGVATNTPASNLDVQGNVTIGSYAGTNAGPTNGMIISGRVGIGTNSPGTNNMVQINPTVGHGISISGTMTAVDAGNNQHAYNTQQTFAPTTGATICSSYEGTPIIAVPVGQTVTSAVTFRSSPDFTGNAGTVTTKYGFWFDGGGAGSGTITTHYGGYFATPVAGTTKIPLYADSATIGTAGTAAPTNGLLVNGAVRNSNLTASGVVYADANKDLTSAALTNGQLLIGSTGANPVAATLTAGSNITITNAAGSITIASTGGGSGIPTIGSSTDNALVRWDGTGGNAVQNGIITQDDTGNLLQSTAVSGASLSIITSNTSNTASATAYHQCQVAGATAADAYYVANISGGQAWSFGLDNSDSDAFVLSATATPGTTNVMKVTTAGEITKPLQPAFSAYAIANILNQTGDGTVYTVAFDTEYYDQNNDYNNATYTFTAPVTGVYHFDVSIGLTGLLVGHTDALVQLVCTGDTNQQIMRYNPYACSTGASNGVTFSASRTVLMTAGDTAKVNLTVSGSTKVVDVIGTGIGSRFQGWLVC